MTEADVPEPELEAELDVAEAAAGSSQITGPRPRGGSRKPVEVDLGEYTVDEIQVCKMGSWGPEGEYVSVGSITLD